MVSGRQGLAHQAGSARCRYSRNVHIADSNGTCRCSAAGRLARHPRRAIAAAICPGSPRPRPRRRRPPGQGNGPRSAPAGTPHPARRRAGCRSGCSARRCPRPRSPSRCLTSARSELPWATTSTVRPAARSLMIASYQYGSIRRTTSLRHSVRGLQLVRQQRVPGIGQLRQRVIVGERRRRDVVGPAPEHELLVAVLLPRLRLVLALQGAVVPLVQPPRPPDRQPQQVRGVQRDVGGLDGPGQHRGVHDIRPQARRRGAASRRPLPRWRRGPTARHPPSR